MKKSENDTLESVILESVKIESVVVDAHCHYLHIFDPNQLSEVGHQSPAEND